MSTLEKAQEHKKNLNFCIPRSHTVLVLKITTLDAKKTQKTGLSFWIVKNKKTKKKVTQ